MTEKNNRFEDIRRRLTLDLIGPFVVHFYGGIARVHAPLCIEHHANFLTDTDDVPLYGLPAPPPDGGYPTGFIYELAGPDVTGQTSRIGRFECLNICSNPEKLLLLDKPINPINAQACHLVLHTPRPDKMVSLIPEQIWIHRCGAGIWIEEGAAADPDIIYDNRARGLRFIYENCPVVPTVCLREHPLLADKIVEFDLGSLNPEALGFEPSQYHIVLRFASNNTASDENHADAYNCFQVMRKLICISEKTSSSEAIKWRVDFDNIVTKDEGSSFDRRGGPHPVDCGAAIIVATNSD